LANCYFFEEKPQRLRELEHTIFNLGANKRLIAAASPSLGGLISDSELFCTPNRHIKKTRQALNSATDIVD
jgi:hypothetical protein